MGNYSQLYIDRLYLSWRNYIPTFLTFLFDPEDFYIVLDPDEPERPEEIGYRTTVSRSIEILDKYGYTVPFFAQVYDFFEIELHKYFLESAKQELIEAAPRQLDGAALSASLSQHLDLFQPLTHEQELDDFVRLLKVLLSSDFSSPPFDEPVTLTFGDGRQYAIPADEYLLANPFRDVKIIDFENLQMYVLHKTLRFPPWIIKLCNLFDWDYLSDYPEVLSLMFVRLALESVAPASLIRLDLSDIVDVDGGIVELEREVRSLHSSLARSLVEKVNLYGRVFRSLFKEEDQIRENYIKSECRDRLALCDKAVTASDKGRALEDLVEFLFSSNGQLELVDKRVSTGDEEIDLVVKNNIDRPFWNALQSPLFFIECKNWSAHVGAKEVRDFEGKLRNHAKLVRVGFFISMNGFTEEALTELKRAGRDDIHLVILERRDIEEYISSATAFFPWLERKASLFH